MKIHLQSQVTLSQTGCLRPADSTSWIESSIQFGVSVGRRVLKQLLYIFYYKVKRATVWVHLTDESIVIWTKQLFVRLTAYVPHDLTRLGHVSSQSDWNNITTKGSFQTDTLRSYPWGESFLDFHEDWMVLKPTELITWGSWLDALKCSETRTPSN